MLHHDLFCQLYFKNSVKSKTCIYGICTFGQPLRCTVHIRRPSSNAKIVMTYIYVSRLEVVKINYSLAYVLRNIETNELRHFHASYNNHLMLKIALLISNRQELLDFLNCIAEESFIENTTRPETKGKIIQISNLTFYINHLQDAPLGTPIPLPDFIMNNHGLANVSAEDNLCFFRCLAVCP